MQATVGGLATVEITGVTVGLRTTPLQVAGGNSSVQGQARLVATLTATLLSGAATVNASMLSPTAIPVNLTGLSAENTTQAGAVGQGGGSTASIDGPSRLHPPSTRTAPLLQILASAQGGLARLELQGLHLSFPYTLAAPGSPLEIPLRVELQGGLVLEGAVGCPASCGAHGRCWLAAAANVTAGAPAAAPACECECGWAGARTQHCFFMHPCTLLARSLASWKPIRSLLPNRRHQLLGSQRLLPPLSFRGPANGLEPPTATARALAAAAGGGACQRGCAVHALHISRRRVPCHALSCWPGPGPSVHLTPHTAADTLAHTSATCTPRPQTAMPTSSMMSQRAPACACPAGKGPAASPARRTPPARGCTARVPRHAAREITAFCSSPL